jgi:hypothetical protein
MLAQMDVGNLGSVTVLWTNDLGDVRGGGGVDRPPSVSGLPAQRSLSISPLEAMRAE